MRLERGDRAAAGPVVRRDDADDLLAEPGDLAADPLLRVGRRPVRRVEFGERAVAGFGQRGARPRSDELRGGVGRRVLRHLARAYVGIAPLRPDPDRTGRGRDGGRQRMVARQPYEACQLAALAREEIGAPGTIRTSDPQIRSLVLYPAELRARIGAGPIGMRPVLGNSYPPAPRAGTIPNNFALSTISNGGLRSASISFGRNQSNCAPGSSAAGSPCHSPRV